MKAVCITSFHDGHFAIEVGGDVYQFDWSEMFGPLPVTKRGRERKLGPRHLFWSAVTLWDKQGKRSDNGLAIWRFPKPPVTQHLGGKHYLVIENGEDGWEIGEEIRRRLTPSGR